MNIELNNVLVRHQSVPECDWCDKSKDLLDQKGIKYTIIDSDKKFIWNLFASTLLIPFIKKFSRACKKC